MLHFSRHDPHLKFVRGAGVAFGLAGSGAALSACTSAISGFFLHSFDIIDIVLKCVKHIIEGSLEVKLPTIWTDEKQSRAEAERRERLEERRSEEKES